MTSSLFWIIVFSCVYIMVPSCRVVLRIRGKYVKSLDVIRQLNFIAAILLLWMLHTFLVFLGPYTPNTEQLLEFCSFFRRLWCVVDSWWQKQRMFSAQEYQSHLLWSPIKSVGKSSPGNFSPSVPAPALPHARLRCEFPLLWVCISSPRSSSACC